jgi:hypothetical protein
VKTRIPKPPKHIDGLTKLATAIADHFKISCQKQHIKNWQKWSPPFPPPAISGSNRYDRAECFDWIERNYLPKGNQGQEQTDLFIRSARAEAQSRIRKDEREAFEFDVQKEKYIPRPKADRTIKSVIIQYHGIVRAEVERISPIARKNKLQELGATPEIINAFHAFDLMQAQSVIDRISDKCNEQVKAYEDQLQTA